jgi:hypothetical protein
MPKRKIKNFFKYLGNRRNVTAISFILMVGAISLALAFVAVSFLRYKGFQAQKYNRKSVYDDELRKLSGITTELKAIPDETAQWKIYENKDYDISIKYPLGWNEPKAESAQAGGKYLQKVTFLDASKSNQKGFEVYVYDSAKFPGPAGTDSLIQKNGKFGLEGCPDFDNIFLGENSYPAKEVSIEASDPCYNAAFFYNLTKDGFTYNIVPYVSGYKFDSFSHKINLISNFPEFYQIISTLNLEKKEDPAEASNQLMRRIIRPQVKFVAKSSCAEKNDHPGYSKTKGKHMDEDCCPDPDEWPNPRCAYSGGGLGLMRSSPKK